MKKLYSEFTPISMYVFKENDSTIVFMRPFKFEDSIIYSTLNKARREVDETNIASILLF